MQIVSSNGLVVNIKSNDILRPPFATILLSNSLRTADVSPRSSPLCGDERGETSIVRGLIKQGGQGSGFNF